MSPPLIVVRTSGFLADFGIQLKEHPSELQLVLIPLNQKPDHIPSVVITTHSDNAASLRIDKPFPSLLAHAFSLNFDKMDVTDHGHIPFVVILVRVLQEWKNDVSLAVLDLAPELRGPSAARRESSQHLC